MLVFKGSRNFFTPTNGNLWTNNNSYWTNGTPAPSTGTPTQITCIIRMKGTNFFEMLSFSCLSVIYTVSYKDITVVGRVIRKKERNYAYQAAADSVRADWERAVDNHANNYPVTYNGSSVKGMIRKNAMPISFEQKPTFKCRFKKKHG